MIKNYFKTTLRNLWKNKATSFINLFGLSVGMTAAVFIFLWVQNEMTFDNFHPDRKNIFRITNSIQVNKDEAWVWETFSDAYGRNCFERNSRGRESGTGNS